VLSNTDVAHCKRHGKALSLKV